MNPPRFVSLLLFAVFAALLCPIRAMADVIDAGKAVDLSASADGTAPFTYVWSKAGVVIPAATGSIFTIANFQAADVGLYSVKISNSAGSITASVTLTQNVVAPSNGKISVIQRILAFLKKLLPWNWA